MRLGGEGKRGKWEVIDSCSIMFTSFYYTQQDKLVIS